MKIKINVIIFCFILMKLILINNSVFSQTTFYTQGFESTMDWTYAANGGVNGNYWIWGTADAHAGTNSLNIWEYNAASWFANYAAYAGTSRDASKTFDLSSLSAATNITLSYWVKCNGESGYDDLNVIVNGTTLQGPLTGITTYTQKTIDLTAYKGNPSVTVIFRWRNDGSVQNQPGARIDDILITYVSGVGCAAVGASCANPSVISTLPFTGNGLTTCGFCDDYTSANACASSYMGGEDYVFRYTPATTTNISISLTNTGTWTGVFVTAGCPDIGTCVTSATSGSGNPSISNISLTGGVTYYIIVDTWPSPACTNFDISINQNFVASGSDCFGADPVCTNVSTITNIGTSTGNYNDLVGNVGCITSGEHNTNWYIFTAQTSGPFTFNISTAVDYDWILYDITGLTDACQSIIDGTTTNIRCSWAIGNGVGTGLNMTATDWTEPAGGDGYCQYITTVAGNKYALMVDRFATGDQTYTIDFTAGGGSAGVVDNVAPSLLAVETPISCGSSTITINMSENVNCSSVSPSDFALTGPTSQTYTITSATGAGIGCASNGYEQNFILTISPAIAEAGNFTLNFAGAITDVCGQSSSSSTKNFTITGVTLTVNSQTSPTCNGGTNGSIAVTASTGTAPYTYTINGGAAQGSGTFSSLAAGTYNVEATDVRGCSKNVIITLTNPSVLSAGTIGSAQTICYNTAPAAFISVVAASGGSGTIVYQWQRDAGCVGTWVDVAGATGATYTSGVLTQTTCFRRRATDNCTSVYSNTITITVNPQSVGGTASAAPASVCYNTTSVITLTGYTGSIQWYSSPDNTTWTIIAGATAATYTTPTLTANKWYRAVVTSGGGCATANSTSVLVTVYAQLVAGAITGYTSPVCYNTSPGTFSSNASGGNGANTITWYNSGGTNLGTGTTFNPGNLTASTGYYYTVSNSCGTQTSATVNITVNPNANVIATPASQTICSGNATSIALTSGVGGASFSWTVVQSGVSGASVGSGTSITQTLSNSGTTAGTATYTVTATASGCPGTPTNVIVTVNPRPTLTITPIAQTICSGVATNIALTSNVAGTTYAWTVVQSGVSGASAGSGTPIAQTLTNAGATAGTATYTITPTANTCAGTAGNVVVTVSPLPVVTATPPSQSICSGSATGIALTSNVSGTTFAWTVTQSGVSGATNSNGTSIAQTLTYSGAPGTATYLVTGTANTCSGSATSVTVTVNPLPAITSATKTNVTICGGSDGTITIVATGAAPLTYSINGGSTWVANGGSFTGLAAGNYPVAVRNTYGCIVYGATLVVGAGGAPSAPVAGTNATYCSGVVAANLTATIGSGGTITWWSDPGLTINVGLGISFNPNALLVVGSNDFYATETVAGCRSSGTAVTITVNALPVATATPSIQNFCSGGATNVALTSTVVGTTYSWTVAQAGVSGASNSSGSTVLQTLTATGTTNGTATYTITPVANTCTGSTIIATITVKPIPNATSTPASQSICSGVSTGLNLTSNVGTTTFSWTVAQSGVSGASAGSGSSIVQSLSNSGTTAGTATYTITPSASSCNGTPINVVVTVNPIPNVTATPALQTICSNLATAINLTSTVAGTTFSWAVTQSGVTGATASSGSTITQTLINSGTTAGTATYTVTPSASSCNGSTANVIITVNPRPTAVATPSTQTLCSGASTSVALSANVAGTTFSWTVVQSGVTGAVAGSGTAINQALTNSGTTSGTATYTITPTANSCAGTTANVVITVNPIPNITATPASQTICSGAATNITLTSLVGGTSFSWVVSNSAGISGSSNSSGSTIVQTITNSATSAGTATYIITPSASSCNGTPLNVIVTVNPKPNVNATPSAQTICSGASTSINLTSDVAGATFSWTVTPAGVTGASAGSGATIAQTLTRAGTTSGTVTYSITPIASTCPGTSSDVVVTVNPIPTVTASPASQTICSGANTSITLSSGVGGATFSWTVSSTNISGASNSFGSTIAQTLTNTVTTASTATYTVTPIANSCSGSTINVPITVNPTPSAIATPSAPSICSGSTTNVSLTSDVTGATFSWTVTQSGVTGATNSNGTTIAQTLTNSGTTPGSASYTVTPSASSCNGIPISVVVTVNPIPVAIATPASQTICSGNLTSIAISSNVTGTTFAWTASQTGVTGASSGIGASISQLLTNSGIIAGTATYNITPTASSCNGSVIVVPVTVNPIPNTIATPASATICSGTATSIALTSSVSGTSFSWTVTQSGVTGASSGSGTTIAQIITNSGTATGTATYSITPVANTCSGSPTNVVVTVNPVANVIATPSLQTICSGTATGIALTSAVTGTSFTWAVVQSGVSGASAGSGTSIAQTLTNSGTTAGTATYTITPTANGCVGTPLNIIITVNPRPTATATPASQIICSNSATSIALTSNVAGTTYVWAAVQSGVTGASAGSGSNIAQTITTSGTTSGTATYTITPTANTCSGTTTNVIVTVNPLPTVTATPASQSICSGNSTGIALTSNVAGTTYAWTILQSGVTGASAGSGANIAQTLTYTGAPGTAVYSVTGTATSCSGTPASITITVNPLPVISSAVKTDVAICGGSTGTISITASGFAPLTYSIDGGTGFVANGGGFSGLPAGNYNVVVKNGFGCTVAYTSNPLQIGGGGAPPAPAAGTNASYCQGVSAANLTATAGNGGILKWYSNPGLTTQIGAAAILDPNPFLVVGVNNFYATETVSGCQSLATIVTITVNPLPVATATPASQTFCSGTTTAIALTSTVVGTTFNWTVAQSGVSGATVGSGSTIAQTLLTTGIINGTSTYTITPTTPASCPGTPITVVITVKPIPVATVTPSSQTLCNGGTTSIALTSNVAGSTFSWTVAQTGTSGATAGSGTTIAQVLTNSGSTQGTATYSVTPLANACSGTSVQATVTVNPTPNALASPAAQTICSNATTAIALTSSVTGTTFNWTIVQGSGISGASAGSGSNIIQTIANSGTTSGTATYTITPTANSCNGTPIIVIVTVNPIPGVTATPSSQTLCSGSTTSIALSSGVAGASFSWTVIQSGVLGATAGSGSTISQTLTNSGISSGTATYSVTPSANSCNGTPSNIVVTVNPIPNITATPTSQTICSGASTNIALSSNVVGATFSWTVANSAGITGSSNGSGSTIIQTVSNSGNIAGTATYTITPSANSCSGSSTNVVITINPRPNVNATPAAQTICSATATSINLTSNVAGTTYSWTISQTGVTGATAGSGSTISQTLTTSGTTSGSATYTITPTANLCTGNPFNAVVTVNPIPNVTATPALQTICSGGITSINLTSNVSGTTFSWTVNAPNITGSANSSGNTISQTLINTITTVSVANYTITPSASSCAGTVIVVPVTVNPTPNVTATPSSQAICSGSTTGITLTSSVTGSTFSWTVTQSGATGATNGSGNAILQVLSNTATTPGSVTYSITPSANSCSGAALNVVVTVNPIPTVTASPSSQSICSGAATEIYLSSNVSGSTYSWTVTQAGVTGAASGIGSPIAQTLTNSGTTAGTATYTVSASANSCNSATLNVPVTVNPIPNVSATPPASSICGGATTAISLSSNVSGATFAWTISNSSANISGSSTGSGSNINQTLNNSGTTIETVTYTVTPTASSCSGTPIIVVVTVKPVTAVIASPTSQSLCSGGTTSINLTSGVTGTTFSWSVSASGISGASAGSGSSITQILTNTSISPATATYIITPSANGCSGVNMNVLVTVNPIPGITATPSSQTICSNALTSINLSSTVSGTAYSWTVVQSGVTGATAGSGFVIAQPLINSNIVAGTATYSITPTANTCSGAPINVIVTVNPLPNVVFVPTADTICSEETTNIALSSSVAGATFSWTTTGVGVSGNSNGTGFSIFQTLINTGGTTVSATYSVTPIANSCTGVPSNIVVDVRPLPVITSTNHTNVTLCGGANGTITITATGQAPLQYSIDNAVTFLSNGGSFTNLDNANYPVAVSNGFGCIAYGSVVAVVDGGAPIAPAAGVDATYCFGVAMADLTANASSGGTLTWYSNPALTNILATGVATFAPLTTPGISEYYVTETVGGCQSPSTLITINVNQLPVISSLPSVQAICSNGTTNLTLTSDVTGTIYNWTTTSSSVNLSGYSNGSGNLIMDNIANSGSTSETVTYNVLPIANGCFGAAIDVIVTVNPIPDVIANPANESICSGSTTNISFTSGVGTTSFAWTVSASGISGALNGSGTSLLQTLINSGISPAIATYTVTPTANTCIGNSITVPVTVNPVPDVAAAPTTQVICSGAITLINLSSNTTGASFSWTASASNGNISGYIDDTGTSISQTLTNIGNIQGTVTYLITPFANSCNGTPITAIVTVYPLPVITATPPIMTLCSGGSTSIVLSSNVSGTAFNWTVSNPSGNISGAVNGSGNNISQILNSIGSGVDSVIYHVNATANSCSANLVDITVRISPIPDITATPTSQSLCSGDTTLIVLETSVTGVTFNWSVTSPGISGAISGSGDTIQQVLTNLGSLVRTAIYTITPSAGLCEGSSINVSVSLYPKPSAVATPSTQVICSGDVAVISITSSVVGTTYDWTVTQTDVTGGLNGIGNIISPILDATASIPGVATYSIIPSANSCKGDTVYASITVNPLPVVTAILTSDTICSGGSVAINLSSNVSGSTITWTASAPGITGALNGSGTVINATLFNLGINPATATYTISSSANGCAGISEIVQILVNPVPIANAGIDQSVFFGSNTTLVGAGSSSSLNIVYNWTPVDSIVSGINSTSPVTINLTTTTLFAINVTDTITGCAASDNVLVTVSGLPLSISSITSNQVICQGDTIPLSITATGGSGTYLYQWTSSPAGFTSTDQTVNVSPVSTTIYYVTVSDGFLTADSIIFVTVNALPIVNIDTQQPVCQGTASVLLTGATPLGGSYSGSGVTSGQFNPVIAGVGSYVITYTFTDGNSCTSSDTATITVNTLPTVTLGNFTPVCIDAGLFPLTGGTPVGGFYSGVGVNSNTFNPFAAGVDAHTITYTYIDGNNCSGYATNMIVVNQVPSSQIDISTNVTCNGVSDGTATVTATGGSLPYTYLWDNTLTDSLATATGLDAGIMYHVTINDANNCIAYDSVMVTEPAALLLSTETTDATCGLANGSVAVTAAGGTPQYSYTWQNFPLNTGNVLDSIPVGNYTVNVIDNNNCTQNILATINSSAGLQATISSDSISCFGLADGMVTATVTNGTAPYDYIWSTGDTTLVVDSLNIGIFSIIITDAKGCTLFDTVTVAEPAATILILVNTNVGCYGLPNGNISATTQGGTVPYTYVWNTGYTGSTLTAGAGSYCLTATDASGCSVSSCDTITQPASALTAIVTADSATCWGSTTGQAQAVASGGILPYSFIWNTNPIQSLPNAIELLGDTTYTVTVTDANNCHQIISVHVGQPSRIEMDSAITKASCEEGDDGMIQITAMGGFPPYTYLWYTEPVQTDTIAIGLKPDSYDVKITDSRGCSQVYSLEVPKTPIPCLEIPTAFTPNADGIHDKWNIKNLHLYPNATIEVYNRWGNIIYNATTKEERWDGTYNGNPVPNGSYIYIINLNNETLTKQGTVTVIR